ncbi:MAG: DNA (cytosine-5-)-methyltransferase [Micavibrio aeruginosavorus]|uniref:DNA (cytosine-5-)-methyltransferase n=1 Tax=Micavibrio aeruginosavorus TaxID=349221 RepID=A0A2W5MUR2_9BACT|nr:MAG: DNA (cytosine-5-)-methyltransferase [Micavibrio aeruginosavorus]
MKTKKKIRSKKIKRKIVAIDLFCGAGGLTHGLLKESVIVKAGFDIDPACQYAFEANNKADYILKDVAKVTAKDIDTYFAEHDAITMIAGCAPCQPFSKYTQGQDTSKDEKWGMLYHFARIVEEVLPDIVTMENVPQLKKHSVYEDFEKKLRSLGYHVSSNIVYCPDYGMPQTRQRLVLLASRLGQINLIKPTHKPENYNTVRKVIGKLPAIKHGEAHRSDPLHISSKLSDKNLQRIRASKPDGSWLDWDQKLVANCHRAKDRQTYRSVYGRMSWDKPSPTVTTQFVGFGNGRFGHPTQDRAISLREGALLQTFPKNYKFNKKNDPVIIKNVARMIGNAVPVKLGKIIGKSIIKHVEDAVA